MENLEIILKLKEKRFLIEAETSHNPDAYEKYEEMRNLIWGEPRDNLAGTRNLASENYFNDGSSLFFGAYVEDDKGHFVRDKNHLAGFSYGFFGAMDKQIGYREPGNLHFYTQYTAVADEYLSFGLGAAIKQFQKDIIIGVFGINFITCTFDPLTGVNAYRNIHRFGMDVVEYREACYKDFSGYLNRLDIPADRFFVSWDLKKKKQILEYDVFSLLDSGAVVIRSDVKKIDGKNGPFLGEVVKDIDTDPDKNIVLVEIPFDFYAMLRETDVVDPSVRRIPLDWRENTRIIFQTLFKAQYKVIDFRTIRKDNRQRDFYVLAKKDNQT